MDKLRVDVWSDIACPWCFVGKRRLEAALARLPEAERKQVEVTWHAFELDPEAPRERERSESYAERLAKKYGMSVAQAEARIASMTEVAKADGVNFDFARIRPGNTFDAHRLLHLAAERGLQDALKERFLLGYMSEGEAIGQPEALERLAIEAGLGASEVRAVLTSDRYAAEVRADERDARELGINGVPFFVLDERLAVSGAQPTELFLRALKQAFADRAARPAQFEEGALCGPDGC
ncbi:MAG TPA: DsbA family oxidoreductase [Polyangiaceae bacterium]|jgi:predicted DsbA family dithiol-disulfide isomerase|nr:DsbA family oxidoreductase [Polyangiaceae bacterium]